jgi:hypothetical protein
MSGNRVRSNVQNCVGLETFETPEWSNERELSGDKDPGSKYKVTDPTEHTVFTNGLVTRKGRGSCPLYSIKADCGS